jgi:hypothetical protein
MTGVALATMAVVGAPASAETITLHYFFKQVRVRLTDAAGHVQNPRKRAVAGDLGDQVGLAYVGNHSAHAKRWTASYHLRCVFRRSPRETCDAQIAVGGSMLLANGIHPNLRDNLNRVMINGGTGVFQRAHGTLTSVNIGNTNNSDITVQVKARKPLAHAGQRRAKRST